MRVHFDKTGHHLVTDNGLAACGDGLRVVDGPFDQIISLHPDPSKTTCRRCRRTSAWRTANDTRPLPFPPELMAKLRELEKQGKGIQHYSAGVRQPDPKPLTEGWKP